MEDSTVKSYCNTKYYDLSKESWPKNVSLDTKITSLDPGSKIRIEYPELSDFIGEPKPYTTPECDLESLTKSIEEDETFQFNTAQDKLSTSSDFIEIEPTYLVQSVVEKIVGKSKIYKKSLTEVRLENGKGVLIKSRLVEDCLSDCAVNSGIKKHVLAGVNNELKPFKRKSPLQLRSPGREEEWNSLEITPDEENPLEHNIIENLSVPTSKALETQKNDLTNFNFQINKLNGHICITCGGIDTKRKADEFVEGVLFILKKREIKNKQYPVRILLHQVNSFINDRKLLENEHRLSRYIEHCLSKKLSEPKDSKACGIKLNPESPLVAHINLSLNFASSLPERLEDGESKLQNLEGLAAQLIWLIEDMKVLIDNEQLMIGQEIFNHIDYFKTELIDLRSKILAAKDNLSSQEKLFQVQTVLSAALKNTLHYSHQMERNLTGLLTPAERTFKIKLRIYNIILAKQLGCLDLVDQADISRVAEIELHLLLDFKSKYITEINCKSGIDRTGLSRSLWDALNALYMDYYRKIAKAGCSHADSRAIAYEKTLSFLLNQDRLLPILDEIQYQVSVKKDIFPLISRHLKEVESSDTPHFDIREEVLKAIDEKFPADLEVREELKDILNYHDLVVANMFAVAQVITIESTGVAGLKYGHDNGYISSYAANPHPLQRLPMFITTEDRKVIQLLDLSRLSSRTFTSAGMELILRNSSKRGA